MATANPFVVVLGQMARSPVTTVAVSVLVATWVKIFHGRLDMASLAYSYDAVVAREQYWKVLTSPLCHASFAHMIVNVVTLWAIRDVEAVYGSWFFFRYTAVLMLAEAFAALGTIAIVLRMYGNSLHLQVHPIVRTLSCHGCSSIILAWLAFQSVSGTDLPRPFFLLGILPIPWTLAPLMMIFISPAYAPRFIGVTNGIGLMTGYLLGFGVLKVLPDWYWSACFVVNVGLFLAIKAAQAPPSAAAAAAAGSADDTEDGDEEEGGIGALGATAVAPVRRPVVGPSLAVRRVGNPDILDIHVDLAPPPTSSSSGGGGSGGEMPAGGEAGGGEAGAGEEPEEEEEEEEEEGGFLGYRDDAFHAAQRVPLTAATPSHGSGGGGGLIGRHPSRDSLGPS